jgi:TRAP-type mannitol/chloroaromatic compound transport system permease small subunit
MKTLEQFLGLIDAINTWMGRIVAHLLLLLMLFMTYEVVMRYIFTRPSLWAMELNQYISVVLVALGAGYTLLNGKHINADVLYSRLGERTRAIFDLVTAPLFFLFIIVLFWQTLDVALESWELKEYSQMAGIPVYPVRITIVVGAVLLLLQGFAKFVRDFTKAVTKKSSTLPEKG